MISDAFGKPFKLYYVRTAQMILFANIVCDPPLGQATIIPLHQQTVHFTVLIESSRSFPEQGWEAVLWHNGHENREWRELALQELTTATSGGPLAFSSKSRPDVYRRYFLVDLPRPRSHDAVQFTLKFRTSRSESWKWINQHSGLKDGELYFQCHNPPQELFDYLKDYSSELTVHSVASKALDVQLWSISAPISAAEGKASAFAKISLGTPRSFTRWFSLVRIWVPWVAPRHGQGDFSPDEDVLLCSFLRWDGLHLVLLAVSGVDDVLTVLKSDGQGNVIISSRNDSTKEGQIRVIAAVGKTFESANAAVWYHARKLIHGDEYMSGQEQAEAEALAEDGADAEWLENWYDGLTYCTWNGLGQNLNERKIYDALDVLKDNGIKITNLIIDDGWQSTDNYGQNQGTIGWSDFDAHKKGFPQGIKNTITQIRKKHQDIEHIAVWHAILGYWGGISPSGNIAKKYKTRKVRKQDGESMTVVDADDAQQMYDDFYRFLLDAGIDSVKTDAQFMLEMLEDADDRRRFIKTYQDAWIISSLRYFSTKAISCMSQAPQIIFHSQLPTNKPRLMARNSDDFFPTIPTSHPWHIFTNAHNSLMTSHLNILPDWDMFQTSHPYSSFHAAGRCISGGPIYFTDEPGKHDVDLITQMTAQTTKGKTIILRPTVIGKTTAVYTAYEEERLLKVGTFTGDKSTGTGILGLFNVSHRVLSEFVNLNAFPGVQVGEEYIVRGHTTGEISSVIKVDDKAAVVSLEVEVKGWEILSAYRLRSFTLGQGQGAERSGLKVAVLGLLGKMTGAAAVLNSDMQVDGNGRLRIKSSIKALGVLGIYISDLSERSIEDTILITILGKGIPLQAVTSKPSEAVLHVDIERAWNELGLDGGWSNEIPVVIFISQSSKETG